MTWPELHCPDLTLSWTELTWLDLINLWPDNTLTWRFLTWPEIHPILSNLIWPSIDMTWYDLTVLTDLTRRDLILTRPDLTLTLTWFWPDLTGPDVSLPWPWPHIDLTWPEYTTPDLAMSRIDMTWPDLTLSWSWPDLSCYLFITWIHLT